VTVTDRANVAITYTLYTASSSFSLYSGPLANNVFSIGAAGTTTFSYPVVLQAAVAISNLPAANPGAGTKQLWYDPADGNRVKFAA
jgi:hypothetical protein